MPSLFVIQGRDQGKRFELTEDQIGVGRDPSSGIRLHDTEVSRRHAELRRVLEGSSSGAAEQSDGTASYEWVDLASSNGSFVNSLRIDRQRLRSGDRVQVGRTLMIYTESSESATPLEQEVDIVEPREGWGDSQIVHSLRPEPERMFLDDVSVHWKAVAPQESPASLQLVYRAALAVSHTLDIDLLLQKIMDLIFEGVDADRGCIMLVDRESDELVPKVRRDRKEPARETPARWAISRTILEYVRTHQEAILTSDAREDQRWDPAASIVQHGVREALCVPMQGRYGVVGVIYLDTFTPPVYRLQHPESPSRLRDEDLKLMVAMGHQAALAIEDTNYYSALVQAERLAVMGQTIAGISHHVKNILQGMRGGSFLLTEGIKQQDWELARKGGEILDKNQERISALVMDMLTFSKEREPELAPSDLNEVVGDCLALLRPRAELEGVALVDHRAAQLPRVNFDPEGIHRALLNILSNAIDACLERRQAELDQQVDAADDGGWASDESLAEFETTVPFTLDASHGTPDSAVTSPHGSQEGLSAAPRPLEVVVTTHYDPQTSRLEVAVDDTGVGIPPEQLSRIFTMFVSSKGRRGTGLGLAVSQKILQEHGGTICVDSQVGRGSTFTLEFPANLA